jgi:hypothetical protein
VFEANIALINKKGIATSITFTFFVIAMLCAYSFYFEGSDFAKEKWPFKLLLVDFIICFVPLALTFTLAWFARQYKQTTIHSIAIATALVQTALFPIFALFTSCYTGLDCV